MRKALTLSGKKPEDKEPSVASMGMYGALLLKAGTNRVPVYDGSIERRELQKRRAKGKVAKASRKRNRRG